MRFVRLTLWTCLLALCAAPRAQALGTCTISSTALSFGNYNVFAAAPLDSAGVINFDCTLNMNPGISISAGNGASYNPRLMSSGANQLSYNVYFDAARTRIWDGTPIQVPNTGCTGQCQGSGTNVSFYGRIFAQQDAAVGVYSDQLVVTINF